MYTYKPLIKLGKGVMYFFLPYNHKRSQTDGEYGHNGSQVFLRPEFLLDI